MITLDLGLPGMDGWEVLKRLKSDPSTSNLPVVIISMSDNRELGIALGADDYFVKPIDRERLISRIEALAATPFHAPPRRLLVIDDDEAVHQMLSEDLSEHGFHLERAYSGEEGLASARRSMPDVVVLDLMMPGMSGFEVADALKASPDTASVPIVILTCRDLSSSDRERLKTKISGFVQKGDSARGKLIDAIQLLSTRRASPVAAGEK